MGENSRNLLRFPNLADSSRYPGLPVRHQPGLQSGSRANFCLRSAPALVVLTIALAETSGQTSNAFVQSVTLVLFVPSVPFLPSIASLRSSSGTHARGPSLSGIHSILSRVMLGC